MPGQLSNKEKQERVHRLEVIDAEGHEAFRKTLLGAESSVLWEQVNKEGYWEGLTPGYIRVYTHSDQDLEGKITPVRLDSLFEDGMNGVII